MTFAHDTIKNVEHDYTIVEWGIVLLSAIRARKTIRKKAQRINLVEIQPLKT